jgi:hypothetical protein
VWLVCELTLRSNISPPFSGSKILSSHLLTRWFLVRLIFDQENGDVPPKRRFTYGLHGAISQKLATFILKIFFIKTRRRSKQNVHTKVYYIYIYSYIYIYILVYIV